jgi:hypothetical protein
MAAPTVYQGGSTQITVPVGTERAFVDNGYAANTWLSIDQIAGLSTQAAQVYNTSAITASGTLTAANISGGSDQTVLAFTGTFSAPGAITLPLATALIAALGPTQSVGSTYNLRIINTATSQTLTVTTNTGWTVNGTTTIATATWRDFIVTITSATTATIQDIAGASTIV